MSYSVMLWCGCTVDVSCNAATGKAHSRTIERRGTRCSVKRHEVGTRAWLWELLPNGSRHMSLNESRASSDRQVAWRLRRGDDSAWCVLRPVGDRVDLHITMTDDVVMSQHCSGPDHATATSNLWRTALIERGWVDANPRVTLKPKPDRRIHVNAQSA